MNKAKEELGKTLLNLANLLLVLFLLNTYLQKEDINFGLLFFFIYVILGIYRSGYILIKESENDKF